MPDRDIEAQIRAHVDSFVAELSGLIRQAALQSVEEAIGATLGASGARRPARAAAAPRGRVAAPRRKKKGGRRARRGPEELETMGAQLVEFITAHPGQRLEEISATLGIDSGELRQPVQLMLADGRLRTEGKARGTRYFADGGRKAVSRKKAGKRRKKKAARGKKRVTKK